LKTLRKLKEVIGKFNQNLGSPLRETTGKPKENLRERLKVLRKQREKLSKTPGTPEEIFREIVERP